MFPVVTVQNQYNLVTRGSEDVLDYCEKHGIGFIPWYPLAAGDLAKPGSLLDGIAKKHKATPAQIALAWVLKRSPVMLPIPGTGKVRHLEENVAAADIVLSDEEFAALGQGRPQGKRKNNGWSSVRYRCGRSARLAPLPGFPHPTAAPPNPGA